MATKKPVPEIPFEDIEKRFDLGTLGPADGLLRHSPAVGSREPKYDGYYIRVVAGISYVGNQVTTKYDYFYLSEDGSVLNAPRGYAKDYHPARITDMDAAVAKYAVTS